MILYEGPSRLDNNPIVAIATINSKNSKTGDMIQIWILRSDIPPHEAVKIGHDYSICGDCPQRHYLGGGCYVIPYQAPLSVYRAYKRGRYSTEANMSALETAFANGTPIRVGAYGDPGAVPTAIWRDLLRDYGGNWTGYTHQWRRRPSLRSLFMASVDSSAEARDATRRGWRYFRGATADDYQPGALRLPVVREIECAADSRGVTCADCRLCNGARDGDRRASIAIEVHGARASSYTEKAA